MTLEDIARLKLEIDVAKSKESLDDLKLLSEQDQVQKLWTVTGGSGPVGNATKGKP